jgi:broad specificity phosphatase PhoE
MNVNNIIGGNGNLSPNGEEYGMRLGEHINQKLDLSSTKFITSSLNRTRQTAKLAGVDADQIPDLDEISAGDFDGFTFDDVKSKHTKII